MWYDLAYCHTILNAGVDSFSNRIVSTGNMETSRRIHLEQSWNFDSFRLEFGGYASPHELLQH